MSAIQNLVGVLISPGKTFAALREQPKWLMAMVILLAVAITGQLIAFPKIDWEEVARMQLESSSRQMTEAQMEQGIEMGAKFGSYASLGSVILGFPLVWLVAALLMWMLIRMLGGLELSYVQSLSTTVHSMAPWIVHTLLSIPLTLTRSEISGQELQSGGVLKHGLASFMEAEGPMLQFLTSINVFTIWAVILMGIGFSVVGRVSKGKAFGAAIAVWIIGILLKVGSASLGG